ncbi:hypothetical protein KAR91_74020 [Candidatus Pacearchaeota archaeon]|nr:hypothetical protein [Candidatus Pacearchaeota archaeon]
MMDCDKCQEVYGIDIPEDEVICPVCNGCGKECVITITYNCKQGRQDFVNSHRRQEWCEFCAGHGKLDWLKAMSGGLDAVVEKNPFDDVPF